MVLQNYVILQPGVPARVHFTDHRIINKTVTDPVSQKAKPLQALEFDVDELDGRPVAAVYSTVSQKHANDFAPYLPQQRYRAYDFVLTMTGSGYLREYQVQAFRRQA